jgi:hypothetical protein
MAQRTTFDAVAKYFRKLRVERIPILFRELATDILLLVGKLGAENLSGRMHPRNTKRNILAAWYQRALKAHVDYSRGRITTGVPGDHQFGRIITLEEEGGTIVPRIRQWLRIARPIAMLPSGFERAPDSVPLSWVESDGFHSFSLHDAIGTPQNTFFVIPQSGGPVLARRRGGKKSSIEVWYDLRKEQRVPSTESVGAAVDDTRTAVPALIQQHLRALEAMP